MFEAMVAFTATLGLLEIGFFCLAFVLLIVGVAFDRKNEPGPKWGLSLILIIAAGAAFWKHWAFFSAEDDRVILFDVVRSGEFWGWILKFVVLGLVYAAIEFVLTIRESARKLKDRWEQFISGTMLVRLPDGTNGQVEIRSMMNEVSHDANHLLLDKMRSEVSSFAHGRGYDAFIVTDRAKDSIELETKIDKEKLAAYIGSWVTFWPAFLVYRLLGDVFDEIARFLASLFTSIATKFVKYTFKDIFKF